MQEQQNVAEVAQQLTTKLEDANTLLVAQAETEAVIARYKQILELSQKHNLHHFIGEANFGIAQAYSHITFSTSNDLLNEQQRYVQRAYKAFLAGKDQVGCAKALAMLAELSLTFNELKKANFYLRQLKRLAGATPEAEWQILFVEAQIFQYLDQVEEAEQAYKKCLSFGVAAYKIREIACMRKLAGLYHYSAYKSDLARPLYEAMLDWNVRNDRHIDAVNDAHNLAIISVNENDLLTAQSYSQIAVEKLELCHRNISSPTKLRELSKFGYVVRMFLIKILLTRSANHLAFENIELNRARAILQQFQIVPLWQQYPPPQEDIEHYATLQRRDYQRFAEIRDYNNANHKTDNVLIERWKDALWSRQLLLYKLEETVVARKDSYANASVEADAGTILDESTILNELCSLLDEDTTVVTYYWEGSKWFILLVTAQGLETINVLTPSEQNLEHLFIEYRREIIAVAGASTGTIPSRSNLLELERQLYSAFIAPVRPYIQQYKNLYLVPSGNLWGIPLHALGGDEQYLSETHQVAYVFGCSVLTQILKRQRSTQKEASFLGVADPDGTLHGADAEVSQAAKLFDKAKLLLGTEATKTNVLANITHATVIHFACHGTFIDEYPEFSYLKLAQTESENKQSGFMNPFKAFLESNLEDERLEVCSIAQIPISAELVVLSTCHTGQGSIYEGDEFVGFSSAFLTAGADTVLGSLWQIDNQATIEFMKHYYSALQHNSKAEDFQYAQRQLRQIPKYAHPYFWASFLMFGLLD